MLFRRWRWLSFFPLVIRESRTDGELQRLHRVRQIVNHPVEGGDLFLLLGAECEKHTVLVFQRSYVIFLLGLVGCSGAGGNFVWIITLIFDVG